MKYIYAGDSWAFKGVTEKNYTTVYNDTDVLPNDVRMADYWGLSYKSVLAPGRGNLSVLDKILAQKIQDHIPIIWIYTEPGRDFGRITGQSEFDWMTTDEIFQIRKNLDLVILKTIKEKLPNPIALIGGLSDINVDYALELDYTVLHPSWQQWIADTLNSQWFEFGWGAGDIGWRANYNNVTPSKTATFAWDEQIKEWCWWEDQGYFCHEHPSPRANLEFAEYLKPSVVKWLKHYE